MSQNQQRPNIHLPCLRRKLKAAFILLALVSGAYASPAGAEETNAFASRSLLAYPSKPICSSDLTKLDGLAFTPSGKTSSPVATIRLVRYNGSPGKIKKCKYGCAIDIVDFKTKKRIAYLKFDAKMFQQAKICASSFVRREAGRIVTGNQKFWITTATSPSPPDWRGASQWSDPPANAFNWKVTYSFTAQDPGPYKCDPDVMTFVPKKESGSQAADEKTKQIVKKPFEKPQLWGSQAKLGLKWNPRWSGVIESNIVARPELRYDLWCDANEKNCFHYWHDENIEQEYRCPSIAEGDKRQFLDE